MVSLKCENDPKHYKLAHNGGSPIEKGAKGIFHIQKKLASYLSAAVAKRESVFRLFFLDGWSHIRFARNFAQPIQPHIQQINLK